MPFQNLLQKAPFKCSADINTIIPLSRNIVKHFYYYHTEYITYEKEKEGIFISLLHFYLFWSIILNEEASITGGGENNGNVSESRKQ